MSTPKSKASLCFLSNIETLTDSKQVKAAYKDLREQVISFADSIKLDPNALIVHTVLSLDPKDMVPVGQNIVDVKIAELQALKAKIDKGESSLDKPKVKAAPVETVAVEEDEFDPPRVKTIANWEPTNPPIVTSRPVMEVTPTVVEANNSDDDAIVQALLTKFNRVTAKSTAIIKFFVKNAGKNVTIDEIVKGSGIEKTAVNMWLSGSGKAIKAIKNVERGTYSFDASKVKVK